MTDVPLVNAVDGFLLKRVHGDFPGKIKKEAARERGGLFSSRINRTLRNQPEGLFFRVATGLICLRA